MINFQIVILIILFLIEKKFNLIKKNVVGILFAGIGLALVFLPAIVK